MRILLTGGLGFIGSHLVRAAVQAGHEVMVLDLPTYAGSADNLPRDWVPHRPEGWHGWAKCDVRDSVLVEHYVRSYRPTHVIHAAAETHVGRSIECHEQFLRTNVEGTGVLLEACRKAEHRPVFLHVSTDEVYGSLQDWDDDPWTEASPLAPRNPYAASKAAADMLVQSYCCTHGLHVVITRGCNTFGARQHGEKLLPTLCRQLWAREPLTLHGDGLHAREWLGAMDHARGILLAAELGTMGSVFNLGSGHVLTNVGVADMLTAAADRRGIIPRGVVYVEDRPGNDRRYSMDSSLARDRLGWELHDPSIYASADLLLDAYNPLREEPRHG